MNKLINMIKITHLEQDKEEVMICDDSTYKPLKQVTFTYDCLKNLSSKHDKFNE